MIDDLETIKARIAVMSARTRMLIAWSDQVGAEARRTINNVRNFLSAAGGSARGGHSDHFVNSACQGVASARSLVKQLEDCTNDNGNQTRTADHGIFGSSGTHTDNTPGAVAV